MTISPNSIYDNLIKLLVIAAAYFLAARLSPLLAIENGLISPIWPAAGVALAGILLFGYRITPGIFLGAFAANFFTNIAAAGNSITIQSLSVTCAIAIGATLQAIVSAYLIRRVVKQPGALEDEKDIGKILLFGGPIGCTVNATLGPLVLTAAGILSPESYLANWAIWWFGDAVGAILFAPLILFLAQWKTGAVAARKLSVAVPVLTMFAVVITVFFNVNKAESKSQQQVFSEMAQHEADNFLARFHSDLELLHSIDAFMRASDSVNRQEFIEFTRFEINARPVIRALEWIPRIRHSEKQSFEARAIEDGYRNFRIVEKSDAGWAPAARRDEYFPVYYINPFTENENALGFDLGSNPERLVALQAARDSGQPIATATVKLVQAADEQNGFLVFRPVYATSAPVDTLFERREHLVGFALGVFDIAGMINSALGDVTNRGMNLYIYDNYLLGEKESLFGARSTAPYAYDAIVDLAGRQWTLEFTPTTAYLQNNAGWRAWTILIGGLAFTAFFQAFLLVITARTEIVKRLVEARTRDLRRSEERFAVAAQGASVGIWDWIDVNGEAEWWSDQFYRLLGYEPMEIEASLDGFSNLLHTEDRERAFAAINAHLTDRMPFRVEYRLRCKDGTYRWFLGTGQAIWGAAGQPRRMIGSIMDIHERKKAETMKNEFVSTVSHELRTPMTSIMGAISLVRSGKFGDIGDRAAELLKIASTNGDRLVRLINDILDIEKIEAGKIELERRPLSVTQLIADAIDQNNAFVRAYDAQLRYREEDSGAFISADPDRMMQVLTNLISNAAKFSGKGGVIEIGTRVENEIVRISVTDNGPGIPQEKLGAIFHRFVQIDSADNRVNQGTGLGLSIASAIVDAHGGWLQVESEVGVGTTFTIKLASASRPVLEKDGETRTHAPPDVSSERKNILHIEDDHDTVALLQHLMSDAAEIIAAPSTTAAQTLLRYQSFDLVVLDLNLADERGETIIAFLETFAGPTPPLIIYSVEDVSNRRLPEFVCGAYIKSRISPDALREKLLAALEIRETREAALG